MRRRVRSAADPDETVDVGVAADDAVHDDDVVRVDRLRDEVADAPLDAVAEPALGEELLRLVLVLARELDVGGPLGARRQELDLDRPDPAADLEDGRARDVTGELDEIAGRAPEPARAVALRGAPSLARTKDPSVDPRLAAPRHGRILTRLTPLANVANTVSHSQRGSPP